MVLELPLMINLALKSFMNYTKCFVLLKIHNYEAWTPKSQTVIYFQLSM